MDLIEAMGTIEYQQEALFARMMESQAVGVVPNTLNDLLTSRIQPVGKDEFHRTTIGKQSMIAPFKFRQRERNYTSSYFRVTAGEANAAAGVTLPASAWDMVVDVGGAQFASPLPDVFRYFLPGNHLTLEHKSGTAAVTATVKIVAVADIDGDTATVTVQAPFTTAGWAALGAGDKAKFQPEWGVATLLTNNVSDYESWCHNQPWNNPNELIVDWFQTSRFARATNKEYEEMLGRILNGELNGFQKNFKYIDVVKRNQMMRQEYQKQWMNSVWFNGRISEIQVDNLATSNFTSLEQVVDPEDPSCVYEYKANAVGIHTQLVENSRRLDLAGGDLDLDLILDMAYVMQRNRKLDGKPHDTIDFMTDRFTKNRIDQILISFLKSEYGYDIHQYVTKGQVVIEGTNIIDWTYTLYDIPKHAFQLAIFTHPFFDDRLDAFGDAGSAGADITPRGRMLVAMDWNDIVIGAGDANTVHREYKGEVTANANSTWSCVMKLNTKFFDLESTQWDVEFGDYERHLIVENFSANCPSIVSSPCAVT
ncbi:MAG TPA: hypothetical protein VMW69_02575 [Spirochaetia bacterium]|nr:hypothetical protein [Spirochaetia bacterium]